MIRVLKYLWFRFVMLTTGWLPDFTPVLQFRGYLARPTFKKCGKNFQIASGTIINWSSKVSIENNVFIANNCWINAVGGVTIEDEVLLGPFVVISTGDHVFKNGSARFSGGVRGPVKIGRGSWIGAHAVITRGITIGDGSLIGANAVVTHDVKNGTMNAGVPAREICDHIDELEPDPNSIGR